MSYVPRIRLAGSPILWTLNPHISVQACTVTIIRIQPVNLRKTPFIVWASQRTHQHAPPPLTKAPEDVKNQVLGSIRSAAKQNLTFGNPYLLQFFTGQY